MYTILPYSYEQARRLGVTIYPSKHRGKRIDVYKGNKFICAIGTLGMKDFPTYWKERGKSFADDRRRLYHLRHRADDVYGTAGWYALRILW